MSYLSYVISNLGFSCSTLAGSPSLPSAPRRFTPAAPLADLLCFRHVIYMAASARSLERSISTAECKVPSLSSCIFIWNSGSYVSIQEAWKQWNPTENILNLANIESRNRGGLVKLSDSVAFHGASDAK